MRSPSVDMANVRRTERWSQIVQEKISRFCKKNGIYYNKVYGSRRGIMDCVIVLESETMWVEIKNPRDVESPVQADTRRQFNKKREIAYVVHDLTEFLEALQRFMEMSKIYNKKLDMREKVLYDEVV